jgi:hypothetical protein
MIQKLNVGQIILGYLQYACLLTLFELDWPLPLLNVLVRVKGIAMLNMFEGFSPECAMEVSYIVKWAVGILLPFMMMSPLILFEKQIKFKNKDSYKTVRLFNQNIVHLEAKTVMAHQKKIKQGEAKVKLLEEILSSMLLSFYVSMILKAAEPFSCIGDNPAVMEASATVKCGTSEHELISVAGGFMLIIYAIVLPFVLRAKIVKAGERKYHEESSHFEFVLMFQKSVMGISAQMLKRTWVAQWCVASAVLMGTLALHIVLGHEPEARAGKRWPMNKPFFSPGLNHLSIASLVACQGMLCLGLIAKLKLFPEVVIIIVFLVFVLGGVVWDVVWCGVVWVDG